MKRLYGVIAAGALALASAVSPAAAKLNSCDGPIVLGTTISVTGINSSLAGSWDKMTEMFEREFNKTGGVFLSSCNKKLPIKFVYYDDQSVAATAVSLYEKLATIDNVDLFVGPDWSSHGFPVSQVFEKYKIPSVMSNVATPEGLRERLQIHRRNGARCLDLVEELLRHARAHEPQAEVGVLDRAGQSGD